MTSTFQYDLKSDVCAFTSPSEAARLAQENEAESFDVNDQRQLSEVRFRFAARAFRELRVGVRVQDKRITSWQGAESIFPVSLSIHVQVWLTCALSRGALAH